MNGLRCHLGVDDDVIAVGAHAGHGTEVTPTTGERVAEQTEKTVIELNDLDHRIPIDHSVPWNSKDMTHWTLRWILLHLVQETARHAGHADIVRESVDGATAYPLMAAAEGWPETDWLKPWKPASR